MQLLLWETQTNNHKPVVTIIMPSRISNIPICNTASFVLELLETIQTNVSHSLSHLRRSKVTWHLIWLWRHEQSRKQVWSLQVNSVWIQSHVPVKKWSLNPVSALIIAGGKYYSRFTATVCDLVTKVSVDRSFRQTGGTWSAEGNDPSYCTQLRYLILSYARLNNGPQYRHHLFYVIQQRPDFMLQIQASGSQHVGRGRQTGLNFRVHQTFLELQSNNIYPNKWGKWGLV